MLKSSMNGHVSYLALQRLAEQAWDEGDQERLMVLSAAVDRCMALCLTEQQAEGQAV